MEQMLDREFAVSGRQPHRSPRRLAVVDPRHVNVVPLRARLEAERSRAPSPTLDDHAAAPILRSWLVQSHLLEAIGHDACGDAAAADHALANALELAEHDGMLLPFLVHPVPALLERYARRHTAHAGVIAEIFNLLAGADARSAHHPVDALPEPLTETEARVLRYLPTDLSKREIANELYVSVNTIKTHVKHLYSKLDARTRRQAVARARELGLLPRPLSIR